MKVAFFIGSISDKETVMPGVELLRSFGIEVNLEVTSAHRTPERTVELVKRLEGEGVEVFIAAAGGAAHLAGVVAAHTVKPVIAIPLAVAPFQGLDALLSSVQMPKGVPVAVVSVGSWGAVNAALLAVEILSIKYEELKAKLKTYREEMKQKVEEAAARL